MLTEMEEEAWRLRVVTRWVQWMVDRGRWRNIGGVEEEWEGVDEWEGDEEEVMRGRGLERRV